MPEPTADGQPQVFKSEGEIVINLPIEEVYDFVTTPYNWIQLHLGNIDQHGPAGPEDFAPVQRSTKAGEIFVETSITPAGVYWTKHFVTHVSERPYRWGYTLAKSEFVDFDGYIQAEYSLESINDGKATRWRRWRITTLPADAKLPEGLHSLGAKSEVEMMYQERMRAAMEDGVTEFEPIAPLTKVEADKVRAGV